MKDRYRNVPSLDTLTSLMLSGKLFMANLGLYVEGDERLYLHRYPGKLGVYIVYSVDDAGSRCPLCLLQSDIWTYVHSLLSKHGFDACLLGPMKSQCKCIEISELLFIGHSIPYIGGTWL